MKDRLEKNFYIPCREKFREYIQENLLYKCNREIYLVITFLNILYIVVVEVSYGAFFGKQRPLEGGEPRPRAVAGEVHRGVHTIR